MPEVSLEKFRQQMQSGKIDSLYLFVSEEVFIVDEMLELLDDAIFADSFRDFNLDVFYGQQAELSEVRDAIQTLPMMASRRVVFLKEAQDIPAKKLELLLPIIQNPVDTTTFVMVASKVDQRKKVFQALKKQAQVVSISRLYENQVPQWVEHIARKNKVQMSREAIDVMIHLVGTNLIDIDHEMKKLAQYMEGQSVGVEELKKVVSHARVQSVFELTDAIGSRNELRALTYLERLLQQGQNEVGVLALMTRHLRLILATQEGMRKGLSGTHLSREVGVSRFFLSQYMSQSRLWSEDKLRSTYQSLMETDLALKSSPIKSRFWLEKFVMQACS